MDKIENLVFQGAGVRGIAYLGALDYLNQRKLLNENIKRVAGASAGAITALLLALTRDYDEIEAMANNLDYHDIPGPPFPGIKDSEDQKGIINKLKGSISNWAPVKRIEKVTSQYSSLENIERCIVYGTSLYFNYGLHTSGFIHNWFREQIAKRCEGNRRATFYELVNQYGGLDLTIAIVDPINQKVILCSAQNTPNLEVAKAVTASMAIPVYFDPIQISLKELGPKFQKEYADIPFYGKFVDGGTMFNYPVEVFNKKGTNELMPNTLGFVILGDQASKEHPKKDNFANWGGAIFASILGAQYRLQMQNSNYQKYTVELRDGGVNMVDFDIKPNDEKYNLLYNNGFNGTQHYFEKG